MIEPYLVEIAGGRKAIIHPCYVCGRDASFGQGCEWGLIAKALKEKRVPNKLHYGLWTCGMVGCVALPRSA